MATTLYYLSPVSLIVQYLSNLGVIAAGGSLAIYQAGTVNTPQITYTDSTGTSQNANPVTLNSAGRPAAASGAPIEFWTLTGVSVKLVVIDAAGNQLVNMDNLPSINDPLAPGAIGTNLINPVTGFGADLVANAVKSYDTMLSVRAANVPALVAGQTLLIEIEGAAAANDGGGGRFWWQPTSTAPDDGLYVIKPTATAVSSPGRYIRLAEGVLGPQTANAAASTTDLGAGAQVGSHVQQIVGSTTINSFGTSASLSSPIYVLNFNGAPLIVHNPSTLILPGAQNIQVVAGDSLIAQYIGGGWRVLAYNRGLGTPVWIVKSSDQTVTNSTTLTNDTQLSAPLTAGATYLLQLRLLLSGVGATGQGWKIQPTFSGTLTGLSAGAGVASGNGTPAAILGGINVTVTNAAVSQTTGDALNLDITFTVNTAGTLTLQFAQNSATANGTSMRIGSAMILTRLA